MTSIIALGCSVQGPSGHSEKLVASRGLCTKHYQKLYDLGALPPILPRECAACGETFDPPHGRSKYCSRECKKRADAARGRAKYDPVKGHEAYLRNVASGKEQAKYQRRVARLDAANPDRPRYERHDPICSLLGCDLPHRAKGLCHKHYRQEACGRSACRICGEPFGLNDVPRGRWKYCQSCLRDNPSYHRRQEAIRRGDRIDARTLGDRDGWTCGICGEPVDPAIPYQNRMGRTIDHIVPIAHGGEHTWENVQLAHRSCNSQKSTRLDGEWELRDIPTSMEWALEQLVGKVRPVKPPKPKADPEGTRAKLSAAARARWADPEYKEHMRKALTGRKHSEETRAKMRGTRGPRPLSESAKARLQDPVYQQRRQAAQLGWERSSDEAKARFREHGIRGAHVRLHVNRGIVDVNCELCVPENELLLL